MISHARKIAFETLRRVEAEGAYATDVLHAELGAQVSPADAALATELTLGVLRWRGLLDFLLERLLRKPAARLDLPVVLALRLGLYQIRFLQRVPARAAVNESVDLVKLARKTSAASLVNAVLRKAAAEASEQPGKWVPADLPAAVRLSILHSHPEWMIDRWLSRFGEARTVALLEANNRAPRLSIAVRDVSQRDEISRELASAGLQIEPGLLLNSALSAKGGSIIRTAAFHEGRVSVQDEASQAIPFLLDVHPGDRVLDLCSAPGGKTPALARAAGPKALVIAADLHGHRVLAMPTQFARLGLENVQCMQLDAVEELPFANHFDRILVDAPCSGTGTLARHPEIRWRLRPEQIGEFHGLQVRILRSAVAALAPYGRLGYSTCSLEPEENESVIAEVLARDSTLKRVPAPDIARVLQSHLAPGLMAASLFDHHEQFRTFPPESHTDGFFAAVLGKT
ncbi:MAG TPA: 16S rRNA (cytosine(967)-C(5))-methyltransferase RsmB [Candidatus Acidoferrales bacterium]|nr:16S rRNA (cytosine(967)-C(5))-methyltransferase RsmB [Candidatus Acidoferrales bacterium]